MAGKYRGLVYLIDVESVWPYVGEDSGIEYQYMKMYPAEAWKSSVRF